MHQPTFLMFKHPSSLTNRSWRASPPVGKRLPGKAAHAPPPQQARTWSITGHIRPHPGVSIRRIRGLMGLHLLGIPAAASQAASDCQTSLTAERRQRIRRRGPTVCQLSALHPSLLQRPTPPRARFQLTCVAPSPLSWLKTVS